MNKACFLSGKKLQKLQGLSDPLPRPRSEAKSRPSDQSTCDMLSEFIVCMLVARKPPLEVETELASFLGKARPLLKLVSLCFTKVDTYYIGIYSIRAVVGM